MLPSGVSDYICRPFRSARATPMTTTPRERGGGGKKSSSRPFAAAVPRLLTPLKGLCLTGEILTAYYPIWFRHVKKLLPSDETDVIEACNVRIHVMNYLVTSVVAIGAAFLSPEQKKNKKRLKIDFAISPAEICFRLYWYSVLRVRLFTSASHLKQSNSGVSFSRSWVSISENAPSGIWNSYVNSNE